MTKLLDPVCGMTVDETALRAPGHADVAFCAPGCRTVFVADPNAFPSRLESAAGGLGKCTCGEQTDGVCRCADSNGHDHHDEQDDHDRLPMASRAGCCGGHGH